MTGKYQARIHEIDEYALKLRDLIPETMKAYGALGRAAQAQGALDSKTKELIALALGVATHCEGCLAYHARNAHKLGASRQEVAEALAVAIQMGVDRTSTTPPTHYAPTMNLPVRLSSVQLEL